MCSGRSYLRAGAIDAAPRRRRIARPPRSSIPGQRIAATLDPRPRLSSRPSEFAAPARRRELDVGLELDVEHLHGDGELGRARGVAERPRDDARDAPRGVERHDDLLLGLDRTCGVVVAARAAAARRAGSCAGRERPRPAATRLRRLSCASRPRRLRRQPTSAASPRLSLRGLSTSRPRRRRVPVSADYPRRGRGVAAIHQRTRREDRSAARRAFWR